MDMYETKHERMTLEKLRAALYDPQIRNEIRERYQIKTCSEMNPDRKYDCNHLDECKGRRTEAIFNSW